MEGVFVDFGEKGRRRILADIEDLNLTAALVQLQEVTIEGVTQDPVGTRNEYLFSAEIHRNLRQDKALAIESSSSPLSLLISSAFPYPRT